MSSCYLISRGNAFKRVSIFFSDNLIGLWYRVISFLHGIKELHKIGLKIKVFATLIIDVKRESVRAS